MRTKDNKFNQDTIIRHYMQPEFSKIPEKDLIDIIPTILDYPQEREILETWKRHFQAQHVPYAITESVWKRQPRNIIYFALWKERRVAENWKPHN